MRRKKEASSVIEDKRVTRQTKKGMASRVILASVSAICALSTAMALLYLDPDTSTSAAASMASVKNERVLIAIDGMQCTSCAKGIKAMLKRTPGVISAEVSYERREADVEYDPSRTSPGKILEAIANMGYKASVKTQRET